MPRKTMRMTEIRALANRYLAGSDPELAEFRRGVASMYEHLAMAANDYHGFNDIVQLWEGEPGKSAYIEDTSHRRHYYGAMSGPDAAYAEDAIKAYRANDARWGPDPELARRAGVQVLAYARSPAGGNLQVVRKDLPIGDGEGWQVRFRGQNFVISKSTSNEDTLAFRLNPVGQVSDWDAVAGGRGLTKEQVLTELVSRPTGRDGYVLSHKDVQDRAEEAENTARLDAAASEIAETMVAAARGSGSDPIFWVTGNAYMPPLRSFAAAEKVWQDDPDGEDFARLGELVEAKLEEARVALECPEYDNALYVVDLARFEYVEDPGDHETLQEDWKPRRIVVCGDCGGELEGEQGDRRHADDHSPACRNRADAARRIPERFAYHTREEAQQIVDDLGGRGEIYTEPNGMFHIRLHNQPGHSCEDCGCAS